jgi:hypothetical protein
MFISYRDRAIEQIYFEHGKNTEKGRKKKERKNERNFALPV